MFNDFEDYLKTLYQDNFDSKNGFLKKIIDIKNKNETIVTKFNSLNSIMECSKKIPIISENSIFSQTFLIKLDGLNSLNKLDSDANRLNNF